MPGILIAVVLLIVYGSLYPWHFVSRELASSPLDILLHSWNVALDRRFLADVVINIALYIPFGMAAFLTFRSRGRKRLSCLLPVLLGALLSGCIEMTQLFTPSRDCSAIDLLNNIIGSAAGVLAGILFERMARPVRLRIPDRAALALLFCWVAWLLFPLVPVLWLSAYRTKLAAWTGVPGFEVIPLLSACAAWLAAGYLLEAAGFKAPRMWLACSVLLVPLQFLIVDRQPRPSDLLGALAGLGLYCAGSKFPAAWFFLSALLMRGLYPLNFTAHPQAFSWVPFGGFLQTNWQTGMLLLIGKAFFYGTAIWLLRTLAHGLRVATPLVFCTLALIECLQLWLPGRTAEITDPLLALLLGAGLRILRPASSVPLATSDLWEDHRNNKRQSS